MKRLLTYLDLAKALPWFERQLDQQTSELAQLIQACTADIVSAATCCTYRRHPEELHEFNQGLKINLGHMGSFLLEQSLNMAEPLLIVSTHQQHPHLRFPTISGGVRFLECGQQSYWTLSLRGLAKGEAEDFLLGACDGDGTLGIFCDAGDLNVGSGTLTPPVLARLVRDAPHVIVTAYDGENWVIFDKRPHAGG